MRLVQAGEAGLARPDDMAVREFKAAQTKLALLGACVAAIPERPFAEIGVAELCGAAQVSEQTFFNYFHRKADLLFYYVDLWRIEAPCRAARAAGGAPGLAFIEALFDVEARGMELRPRMMFEIIGWKSLQPAIHASGVISAAERRLAFPDLPEALEAAPCPQAELFDAHLQAAVAGGDLPPRADREAAGVALVSLFYGVPLALGQARIEQAGRLYRAELSLLWDGLWAAARRRTIDEGDLPT